MHKDRHIYKHKREEHVKIIKIFGIYTIINDFLLTHKLACPPPKLV